MGKKIRLVEPPTHICTGPRRHRLTVASWAEAPTKCMICRSPLEKYDGRIHKDDK